MAASVRQTWGSRTSVAAATLGQAVSGIRPGNTLVVISYGAGSTTFTLNDPTDDVGNTYTSFTGQTWSATFHAIARMAWCVPTTAPGTITVNASAARDLAITVFELSGADNIPADASNNNLVSSATPPTGAITTAQADEIIITGLTHDGLLTTITPPSGFTPGPEDETVTFCVYSSGWRNVSDIQTSYNPSWDTGGASRDCGVVIGSFKSAFVGPITRRMPLGC